MYTEPKLITLKTALYIIGIVFVIVVPTLMALTESFSWSPPQAEYEQMIMGIYVTLGVFLILAARNPRAHASIIWFTVWSSLVHGGIMLAQALADPAERSNLFGDIPALFIVAIVLGLLMPRSAGIPGKDRARSRR